MARDKSAGWEDWEDMTLVVKVKCGNKPPTPMEQEEIEEWAEKRLEEQQSQRSTG